MYMVFIKREAVVFVSLPFSVSLANYSRYSLFT